MPDAMTIHNYQLYDSDRVSLVRRANCLALAYNLLDGSSTRQITYITGADLDALSDEVTLSLPPGTVIKITVEYAPVEETDG